jgi:hypothetical protein
LERRALEGETAHSIKDCWKATEYNKAKVFLEFLYALD